jgi:hypothetical protein
MWTELYSDTATYVADALEDGPLVLSGLPGSGRAPLVRELSGNGPIIEIRPRAAATLAGLKLDMLNSLLGAFATFPDPTTPRDFNRFVAAAFGRRAQDILTGVTRGDTSGLSIAEILAGLPANATVVVHDAHLMPALSDRALWALRARAQEPNSPRIALLTRAWHRAGLVSPDAAFFGFGQAVDLPVPSTLQWVDVHPAPEDDDLFWLLDQSRGLPRVTFAVLDRARKGLDIPSAWRAHVHESGRVAEEVLRLAHGLHPYGPRLLAAVAAGDRVYSSVPEARTDAIAAALRAMRDHDLVYQPRPRRWVIADPALAPHLAAARMPQRG